MPLLAAASAFAVEMPPTPATQPCSARMRRAGGAEGAAGTRKLNEMPPANQVLTVLRYEHGCPKPVVLRRDIGPAPAGN